MKTVNTFFLVTFLCLLTTAFIPTQALAAIKSVQYTLPNFYQGGYGNGQGDGCGVEGAWINIASSLQYSASIYNTDTGTLLSDGDIVSTGTHLRLVPTPFADTDIYWFGTGGHDDSPYGSWNTGAAFTGTGEDYLLGDEGCSGVLFSLVANPPAPQFSFGGTATYNCTDSANCKVLTAGSISAGVTFPATTAIGYDGSGYIYSLPGGTYGAPALVSNIYYPGTWGSYNYSYTELIQHVRNLVTNVVYTKYSYVFDNPASACAWWAVMCRTYPPSFTDRYNNPTQLFSAVIPAQTIPFSLSAVFTNTPPTVPTVTCPVSTPAGVSANYSATATDSDNDTVRYDYDWNNDGTVDQYAPSSGYVSSGTLQTLAHAYTLSGPETIKVRAEDSNGAVSAWGSCSTSILAVTKTTTLTPSTSTINLGQGVTFSSTASFSDNSMIQHNLNWRKQGSLWNWEVGYVPVATVGTSNYTFVPTGSHSLTTTITPTQTGTYDVYTAASSDGVTWTSSPIATITVNAVTPVPNFTFSAATPVVSGGTSLVSWYSVTNATSCTPSGGSTGWSGVSTPTTGGSWTTGVLSSVGSPYTYYLTCTGAGGPTLKTATVIVNPAAVCPNTICESTRGETPISCPQDCKVKYKTF